ncbi:MAG: GGDEF domain-containing protein [Minisyncoccia bacterium]
MARTLKDANQEIVVLRAKIKELEELTLDDLTGLLRRKVFQLAVEEEILRCKRSKKTFAVLVIDLNYLKTVNDTHGHQAGDQMIVSFAEFLKRNLRDCDIVARTGGDEFMVFLPEQNAKGANTIRRHLLETLEQATVSLPFFKGAAIGVATYIKTSSSFQEMYKIADKAMYVHKKAMKKCA